MKNSILLFTLAFFSQICFAQEVPKPEFTEVPYIWIKETNELIMLSKESVSMKTGMKMSYKFSGEESKTKVNTNKISFLIELSNPIILSSMKLYKLELKKKDRQVAVVTGSIGGANMHDENVMDYNSKKVADDLYELVLGAELEKGEYAFTNGMNAYTFSIN